MLFRDHSECGASSEESCIVEGRGANSWKRQCHRGRINDERQSLRIMQGSTRQVAV